MQNVKHGLLVYAGLALCFVTLTACTLKLVSDYDETMDEGATALHKKLDEFFVKLPNKPQEGREYESNQEFYEEVLVDLNSLQVRANGIQKNSFTIQQLDLVERNIGYLTLLHKGCVTGPLTEAQKEKVEENGVDVSVDCKVEYGASKSLPDRGDQVLNPVMVGNLRNQFDQQLGAIMALEMAKKRGGEDE